MFIRTFVAALSVPLLISCNGAQMPVGPESSHPSDLAGVTWQWVSTSTAGEHLTVDAPSRYTLQFDRSGRLAVRADCNRGAGGYRLLADQRIDIGAVALTRAACPPGSLSDRFVADVSRVTRYSFDGREFILQLTGSAGTLHFQPAR